VELCCLDQRVFLKVKGLGHKARSKSGTRLSPNSRKAKGVRDWLSAHAPMLGLILCFGGRDLRSDPVGNPAAALSLLDAGGRLDGASHRGEFFKCEEQRVSTHTHNHRSSLDALRQC